MGVGVHKASAMAYRIQYIALHGTPLLKPCLPYTVQVALQLALPIYFSIYLIRYAITEAFYTVDGASCVATGIATGFLVYKLT